MSTKSDFVAAEEIKGILTGRDKTEQERILRWVAESLTIVGLVTPSGHPASGLTATGQLPLQTPVSHHSTIDLRSFVGEKQPKSDMQFAAAVAYYFRFVAPERERKESITKDDLQTAARLANRARHKRPSVPLDNAVNSGYLDRAGGGAYRLNAVGENLVAMTLPGKAGENGKRGRKKSIAKRKARSNRKG